MVDLNIDIPEQETGNFTPLPEGWYPCSIDSTEEVTTQKGDKALRINFMLDTGRMQPNWYNLWHSNEQPREIAKQELERIGRAVGLANIGDSDELHGRVLDIKLVPRGEYSDVKAYRAQEVTSPKAGSSNGAAKKKNPWE